MKFPLVSRENEFRLNVAPVFMVIFLQILLFDNAGEKVVPVGIITLVVLVGTPPHQLELVFQSVEVVPNHVPETVTVKLIELLVAVVVVTHVALDVRTHVTTSPVSNVEFV